MSKKQKPKPAKRRASAGERLANESCGECKICKLCEVGTQTLARNIDRAIRDAVKETWSACENHESETSESHKAQIKGQIEQRFGVKL